MSDVSAVKKLEVWLEHTSDKVKRNVEIISPDDLKQPFLLHISKDNNIKVFIPAISTRQATSEDRTVPRVTTAPTLLGCIIGYAVSNQDFFNAKDDNYLGGYKIYALPFEAALKPNGRLVYDQRNSDEHWMIAYDKDTSSITPEKVGRLFYQSIQFVPRKDHGKEPAGEGTLYIEITKEEGIRFSKNIFLDKGFYIVTGPIDRNVNTWQTDSGFKARKIDRAEFMSVKSSVADLLGFTEPQPHYLKW